MSAGVVGRAAALVDIGVHLNEHLIDQVGDALRDLQAAVKAGCPPHLVLSGKGQQTAKEAGFSAIADVQIHDDLYAFVTKWLQQSANTA